MTATSRAIYIDHSQFEHQCVRDLAWVMSPAQDLLGCLPPYSRWHWYHHCELSWPEVNQWLAELDRHPQALIAALSRRTNRRLGLYFEDLVAFCIEHTPRLTIDLHDRNRPLFHRVENRQETLGEMDFLLRPTLAPARGLLHLEVAVKFYLGVEEAYQNNGDIRWLGPNARDSWAVKVDRMQHHQLPLSQRVTEVVQYGQFWVKGHLFRPWNSAIAFPSETLQRQCEHAWIACSELESVLAHYVDSEWWPLAKSQWLGGAQCQPGAGYSGDAILAEVQTTLGTRPLMLSRSAGGIADRMRLFVTPDAWPKINPAPPRRS